MSGGDRAATKKYILSFWSAVNSRFSTLSSPAISLSLSGIVVASSREATPYLLSHRLAGDRNVLNATAALPSMSSYFSSPAAALPGHDMVVVMTGLDMCRGDCRHYRHGGFHW